MALWQVLVLSAALFAASVSARYQRIIDGERTRIEDFPYQTSLRYAGRHFCGGSIITKRHIITAGHCVVNDMKPPYLFYYIVTGSSSRHSQKNSRRIANVTIHPDYWADENRAINDIAVITLEDDIEFDQYQQKINLPEQNFKAGSKANVTGWGLIRQIPPISPNQLQKIEEELLSKEECQKLLIEPEKTEIHDTEVCGMRKNGSGVCSGDSGGPMAINGELVGIVSWSDGNKCASGHPDVYTNVYKYKDFIESIINLRN